MGFTNNLNQYFQSLEAENKFSGVVFISQKNSPRYIASFGYASRPWKIRNSLAIRFDTASITKLFTSVAILQLIDQKLLTFDTPIVDFLKLKDTTISNQVTVYHLLTHTSGIGDDCEEEAGEVYADLFKVTPNYSITKTIDFLPQFIRKPANFSPGRGCRYCNCGFVLLGLIIEQISGMTYRDYVRNHIFQQAKMTHSDFFRMDRVYDNVAEGCDPIRDEVDQIIGWKKNIYSYPPIGSPDGGAHVTADDLNRFFWTVKMGKLLSPKLTEAFFSPQVKYRDKDDGTMMYGYGLWFFVDQLGNTVFYQKEGINAGVSCVMRHFPTRDITVILLSNMEAGAWKPINYIHKLVLAEQVV